MGRNHIGSPPASLSRTPEEGQPRQSTPAPAGHQVAQESTPVRNRTCHLRNRSHASFLRAATLESSGSKGFASSQCDEFRSRHFPDSTDLYRRFQRFCDASVTCHNSWTRRYSWRNLAASVMVRSLPSRLIPVMLWLSARNYNCARERPRRRIAADSQRWDWS